MGVQILGVFGARGALVPGKRFQQFEFCLRFEKTILTVAVSVSGFGSWAILYQEATKDHF